MPVVASWILRAVGALALTALLGVWYWQWSGERHWEGYPPTNRGERVQPRPEDFDEWSCQDRLRFMEDTLARYGLTRQDFVTATDRVERATGRPIPPWLLATVVLNELADYGAEDVAQEQMYTGRDRSSGIVQLQPSRILDHRLMVIDEREVRRLWSTVNAVGFVPSYVDPQHLSIETIRGEITDADRHRHEVELRIAWRAVAEPRTALLLAAAEIDYILNELEFQQGGDFAGLYWRTGFERQSIFRAAAENPNTRYRDGGGREASVTHAVVAAYNTGSIIGAWDRGRHGTCYGMSGGHDFYNACTHADNALRLWLHCIWETGWLDGTAPVAPDSATFFGVESRGTRVAYVVDRSSSMKEDGRMQRAIAELTRSIRGLGPGARFRVVFFGSETLIPPGTPWIAPHSFEVQQLESWLGTIKPSGGTEPGPAFRVVLQDAERPEVVFFLTDGEIPSGVAADVDRWNRLDAFPPAVIHTIAFGRDGAQDQLRQIAASTGGQYRFVM